MAKIKGKVDGISFSINAETIGDMDFLEQMYDLQAANEAFQNGEAADDELLKTVIPFARSLFGKKQWERIKGELRQQKSEELHFVRCLNFTFKALEEASKSNKSTVKN